MVNVERVVASACQPGPVSETVATFVTAPPERVEVRDGVALVRCRPEWATAAAVAVNVSLAHLRPWMAWAAEPATEAGLAAFFVAAEELWDRRQDFGYSIVDALQGSVLGGCGLHGRRGVDALEIGYWVHVDRIGQGLATEAAASLTHAAFAIDGVDRVEIRCDDENVRSARVPEKLGYSLSARLVPDEGPCAGRLTQVWQVSRPAWMSRGGQGAS